MFKIFLIDQPNKLKECVAAEVDIDLHKPLAINLNIAFHSYTLDKYVCRVAKSLKETVIFKTGAWIVLNIIKL